MKKSILILALAIASLATAQKGTVLVAGSLQIYNYKTNHSNSQNVSNQFSISPKIGYQFDEHWTVGAQVSASKLKTENSSSSSVNSITYTTNQKEFDAGAFIRYSEPLSELFTLYGDLGAGFRTAKTENQLFNTLDPTNNFDESSKGKGIYVGLEPAIQVNIKKRFCLNFGFGGLRYETLKYTNDGGDTKQLYVTFGQSFNIGISKNF